MVDMITTICLFHKTSIKENMKKASSPKRRIGNIDIVDRKIGILVG